MKHLIDKILLGRFRQSQATPNKSLIDIVGEQNTKRVPHLLTHVTRISIKRIHADKDQVRKFFDQDKLQELAESIKKNGVIQPILVRRHPTYRDKETDYQHYQIIAGERRWRASQLAGIKTMPCITLDLDEDQIFQISLIENIQREQLNAIEEARAYQSLHEKFGHSYDEIAVTVGKSRSHIVNTIRLLKLPDQVQSELADGKLSRGHARAIIGAENPAELVAEITEKKLNVRQVEQRVKFEKQLEKENAQETEPVGISADPAIHEWRGEVEAYQAFLQQRIKSQINLRKNAKGGLTLKVFFDTQEEIEIFLNQVRPDSALETRPAANTQNDEQVSEIATSRIPPETIAIVKTDLDNDISNSFSPNQPAQKEQTPKKQTANETTLRDFSPNWPNRS